MGPWALSLPRGYSGNHGAGLGNWSGKNLIREHSLLSAEAMVPARFMLESLSKFRAPFTCYLSTLRRFKKRF